MLVHHRAEEWKDKPLTHEELASIEKSLGCERHELPWHLYMKEGIYARCKHCGALWNFTLLTFTAPPLAQWHAHRLVAEARRQHGMPDRDRRQYRLECDHPGCGEATEFSDDSEALLAKMDGSWAYRGEESYCPAHAEEVTQESALEYGGVSWAQFPEARPGVVTIIGDRTMPESEISDTEAAAEEFAKNAERDSDLTPRRGSVAEKAFESVAQRVPLPRYECHKRVWALKIKGVWYEGKATGRLSPRGQLQFCEAGHAPRIMSGAWMVKHQPEAGGYWVLDEDARESFTPAEAFEAGHTLMNSLAACGPAHEASTAQPDVGPGPDPGSSDLEDPPLIQKMQD